MILYSYLRLSAEGVFVSGPRRPNPGTGNVLETNHDMPFTLGLAMLVSATFGTSASAVVIPVPQPFMPQAQTVKQYVESYFADIPIMVDIAQCESKFRQYGANGKVLRGNNPDDFGVMQVNQFYHRSTAEKLDIDINTIEGNVEYARYLYEREGTMPWISSSKCWATSKKDITTGPMNSPRLATNSNS